MNYLEKIKPSYVDLLFPLKKWKILSVTDLRIASEYGGSNSGFYKIVSKLEANMLIDSFINSWSNEKFVYLTANGVESLGCEGKSLNLNRDTRFHDSIVSKVAKQIHSLPYVADSLLDFEIMKSYSFMEKIPDFLLMIGKNSPYCIAGEVELTQKSQNRVKQILKAYSNSRTVNNVLYVTDKMSIFDSYKRYFEDIGNEIEKDKFLFLHEPNLSRKNLQIEKSDVFFKNNWTNLESLLAGFG
jgi:hypothetical protein